MQIKDNKHQEKAQIEQLAKRVRELEKENNELKKHEIYNHTTPPTIVPDLFKTIFEDAQEKVSKYFNQFKTNLKKGTIEISDSRYLLVRSDALAYDFLKIFIKLYSDKGEKEALSIGKNFLFDIAFLMGRSDAKNFHKKMKLVDPIAKLSTGPVHFAYTGWAAVNIFPDSHPTPDENFILKYAHHNSFEADSWIKNGKQVDSPVCILNSGYSAGWCTESFGIDLTTVEVSCRAKGDDDCSFIMAPPHKLTTYLKQYNTDQFSTTNESNYYEIPTLFQRRKIEEELKRRAEYDYLTEVYNRGAALNLLKQEHKNAKKTEEPLSFIMLDIDNFKAVNDKYGHLIGDEVLRSTAQVLKNNIRPFDIIGRYGGEEFIIIFKGCASISAKLRVSQLQKEIRENMVNIDGHQIKITVSMGIVSTDVIGYEDIDTIIKCADQLLYLAKNNGGDRIEIALN